MNDLEREFEEMVRANRSTIYTVCYMFSQDQDEVADLFQEVLINLWKSMPTFEGRSNVRSWIYRVSLNVCISLDHKKRRHKTVPLTMDINPYEETESNQNSRQMDCCHHGHYCEERLSTSLPYQGGIKEDDGEHQSSVKRIKNDRNYGKSEQQLTGIGRTSQSGR